MLKRYVLSSAFAVLCAGVAAGAQTAGAAAGQQPPQTQPPATAQAATTTTVEGCVYREEDVPGRKPNIAERAGMLEDYILVASANAATSGAVGTSGAGAGAAAMAPKMFKLEHADDSKLSAVIGKRVKVTGKVDAERGDKTAAGAPERDKNASPDQIELPEFEVTSIEEVSGTCPAKPADRK
jgi:hypothetical protein